jgi:hypothetical protein
VCKLTGEGIRSRKDDSKKSVGQFFSFYEVVHHNALNYFFKFSLYITFHGFCEKGSFIIVLTMAMLLLLGRQK